MVTLTDSQSRRFHKPSESDDLDLPEHTLRAIDDSLKKLNLYFTFPKENDIKAKFTIKLYLTAPVSQISQSSTAANSWFMYRCILRIS